MQKYIKFLRRLPKDLQERVLAAVRKIEAGDLKGLDLKKMSGYVHRYRCRVGKLRIVFAMTSHGNFVLDIDFRGGVY